MLTSRIHNKYFRALLKTSHDRDESNFDSEQGALCAGGLDALRAQRNAAQKQKCLAPKGLPLVGLGRRSEVPLSLGRLVFALALLGCVNLCAETPFDDLKAKLDQAIEENAGKVASDQRVATIGKMYLERLAALRITFLDQGSLDGVLEVQEEIKRFENSGGSAAEFSPIEQLANYQRIYANEIKKIESKEMVGVLHYFNVYDDALLKREEELVRVGFIEKAVEVRKERGRVKKVIRKLSKSQIDPMAMKYFASHNEHESSNAESAENVFFRPGELETAVPVVDNQEAVGDEANLSDEAFDALKTQFSKLLAVHWEMVASDEAETYDEYMKQLRIREFHYQNEGSLDGVLALRAEIKHLKDTGTLSNSDTELKHLAIVQRNFAQDVKKLKAADRQRLLTLYRQYLDDMGELERSLVKKHLIDEAIAVRQERERVVELGKNLAQKDLVLSVFEVSQDE